MSFLERFCLSGCHLPSGAGELAVKPAVGQLEVHRGAPLVAAVNSSAIHRSDTTLAGVCQRNYSPAPAIRLALSSVPNKSRALKLMRHDLDREPKPVGTSRRGSENAMPRGCSHEGKTMEGDVLSSVRAALNSHFDTWVVGC